MISAILTLIFKLINFIISTIIGLIMNIFPTFELDGFALGISAFFDLLGNCVNLTYFVFGKMCFVFADIIAIILALKLIVIPIIIFLRKLVIKRLT